MYNKKNGIIIQKRVIAQGARFMKYENETCPVCGEKFTADSDVVVCPDCGTPHHRECYLKTNHCCNEDRHNTGFIWRPTATPTVVPEKPESKEEIPNVLPPAFSRDKMPENGIASEITIDKEGNQKLVYREIRGNERIGDKTVADYAAVIQKNVRKFIPKFMMMDKTGGKVSWNWAAFFFGPFWLAYRKMWKHAIIAMLVISIIPLVFIKDITNYYQKAMEVTTEYLTSASSGDEKSMEAARQKMLDKMPEEPMALSASSYVEFAIRLVYALFGNFLYKAKCEAIMKKAKEKADTPDKRAAYIKRKGGSSLLCVLAFVFISYAIMAMLVAGGQLLDTDIATILRRYVK